MYARAYRYPNTIYSIIISIIYVYFIEIGYFGRSHGLDTKNYIDFVFLCLLFVII